MKLFTKAPEFLSASNEGEQGGPWVAESNYHYSFFKVDSIPDEFAFIIDGKLNMEFTAGGSMEFLCRITHVVTMEPPSYKRPMLMDFIMLASSAAKMFNELLIAEECTDDDGVNVWIQEDNDAIANVVSEKLYQFYQKL